MIMTTLSRTHTPAHRPLPPIARVLNALTVLVAEWENRHKTRRVLRDLDPHLLRDIGVPEHLAQVEGSKPFWRD
jgi:uncharacterized protein YjiS (DUF1127 family)